MVGVWESHNNSESACFKSISASIDLDSTPKASINGRNINTPATSVRLVFDARVSVFMTIG